MGYSEGLCQFEGSRRRRQEEGYLNGFGVNADFLSTHPPSPRGASCQRSIPPHQSLRGMLRIWGIPWAWIELELVHGPNYTADGRCSPIRLLSPQVLVPNHVNDLAINLVLPDVGLFGIDQNISSALDPNGVTKPRLELNKDGLLVRKGARVEAVSFDFDNARNRLCSGQG